MKYTLLFLLMPFLGFAQEWEPNIWIKTSTVDDYGDSVGVAYAYFSIGWFKNSATHNGEFLGKFQYVEGSYYGVSCYTHKTYPVDFGKGNTQTLYYKKDGKEQSVKFRVKDNLLYLTIDKAKELPLPCKLLYKPYKEDFSFTIDAPAFPTPLQK